eukprot:1187724-Prorocentrum_minimum.AAC.1
MCASSPFRHNRDTSRKTESNELSHSLVGGVGLRGGSAARGGRAGEQWRGGGCGGSDGAGGPRRALGHWVRGGTDVSATAIIRQHKSPPGPVTYWGVNDRKNHKSYYGNLAFKP